MTNNVENRLTQAVSNLNGAENYGYDAAGLRLWKQGPDGVTHVFYNGLGGKPLADFYLASGSVQGGTPMVYFAGKRVDNQSVEDRLGTAVVQGGTTIRAYYPYGELRGDPATDLQFATYKRDSTTNLDYAHHRYYSSQIARFTTPDPYQANTGGPGDPEDPQSWNRYSYVTNDPLNYRDSAGLSADTIDRDPEYYSYGCRDSLVYYEICPNMPRSQWFFMTIPIWEDTHPLPSCDDVLTAAISNFLKEHNSPLLAKDPDFISQVLAAANKIDVDPRLFAAETAESGYGTSNVAVNGNDPFGLRSNNQNLTYDTVGDAVLAERDTLNRQVNNYGNTVSKMYSGLPGVVAPPRGWTWRRPPAYCQGSGCQALGKEISDDMKSMGGDPNKLAYPSGMVGSIRCN